MLENMSAGGSGDRRRFKLVVLGDRRRSIFGMLGGLLGVALFKKKDMPPPPGTVEVLPPV